MGPTEILFWVVVAMLIYVMGETEDFMLKSGW